MRVTLTHGRRVGALTFLALALATCVASQANEPPTFSWRVEPIDVGPGVGQFPSIALDPQNLLQVCYFDSLGGNLKLALQEPGGGWTVRVVDAAGEVGRYAALAISASGTRSVAYRDDSHGALRYGGEIALPAAPQVAVVDTRRGAGQYPSLALTPQGHLQVCFYDSLAGDLRFGVRGANRVWLNSVLDAGGDTGRYTSLRIDAHGQRSVAYYDASRGRLRYAADRTLPSPPMLAVIDAQAGVGQYPSLARNTNGQLQVAYYDSLHGDMRVATEGAPWHTTILEAAGDIGPYSSLVIDDRGAAHIGYYNATSGLVRYAGQRPLPAPPTLDVVDSQPGVGQFPSAALDPRGQLHITYYDSLQGDVRYAAHGQPSRTMVIETTGDVGQYTSLAIDRRGSGYVSYYRATDGALRRAFATLDSLGGNLEPQILAVTPDTLWAGDTGVDLVITGSHFGSAARVFTAPLLGDVILDPLVWPPDSHGHDRLHLKVNIPEGFDGDLRVKVLSEGLESNEFTIAIRNFGRNGIPHPKRFAPSLWFGPEEKWYPVSPLFSDALGNTYYNASASRDSTYLALSKPERQRRATLYYYVHGDDPDEPKARWQWIDPATPDVPRNTECIVYEYWMYYTFNDYTLCGTRPMNKHQHDWEHFFVFVRPTDHRILGMIASAHDEWSLDNIYDFASLLRNDLPGPGYHPILLVEEGSHALSPDMVADGVFDGHDDVSRMGNTYPAWGIRDGVERRYSADYLMNPEENAEAYDLVNLDALKQVIERQDLTENLDALSLFWERSRDAACSRCLVRSPFFPQPPPVISTLVGSGAVQPDTDSWLFEFLSPKCISLSGSCWDPALPWYHGFTPTALPWTGESGQVLHDPDRAYPRTFVRGRITDWVLGTDCSTELCWITDDTPPSEKTTTSVANTLGYTGIAEDGSLAVPNLPQGRVYRFTANISGFAPFEQTIAILGDTTHLGVDGRIDLVPEDSSFSIHATVTEDGTGRPLAGIEVQFTSESNGAPVFSTLTDQAGVASAWVHRYTSYRVTASCGDPVATQTGIGAPAEGTTVVVTLACQPVAVLIEALGASWTPHGVLLRWDLGRSALSIIHGVSLQRADTREGPYVIIKELEPASSMQYEDTQVDPRHTYWYRVLCHLRDGDLAVSPTVTVVTGDVSHRTTDLRLPGATRDRVIDIQCAIGGHNRVVSLMIFDVAGRHVRTLEIPGREPGNYAVRWDRSDAAGRLVARGMYLVRLRADGDTVTKKLVLL